MTKASTSFEKFGPERKGISVIARGLRDAIHRVRWEYRNVDSNCYSIAGMAHRIKRGDLWCSPMFPWWHSFTWFGDTIFI